MLQIFAAILGILIVAVCIQDAYVKKFIHCSLRPTLIVAISAVVVTAIALLHPSWWMIAILSYALFVFWFITVFEIDKAYKEMSSQQKKKFNLNIVDLTISLIVIITIPIVCILTLISHWSIWVGIVFIPLAIYSSKFMLLAIQSILTYSTKKINLSEH